MISLAIDENFDHHILRALLRREPGLDLRTVVAAGLGGADDPTVLAWAAHEGRVLLTHDVHTMTRFAFERVTRGDAMPGVIEIGARASVGDVVEDLLLVLECATSEDLQDRVLYLPFRRR